MGCLIEVRVIGVIKALQTKKGTTEHNDCSLGAAIQATQADVSRQVENPQAGT